LRFGISGGERQQTEAQFKQPKHHFAVEILNLVDFFFRCIKLLTIRHPSIEADLYDLAMHTNNQLENVHPGGKLLTGVSLTCLNGMLDVFVSNGRLSLRLLFAFEKKKKKKTPLGSKTSFHVASFFIQFQSYFAC